MRSRTDMPHETFGAHSSKPTACSDSPSCCSGALGQISLLYLAARSTQLPSPISEAHQTSSGHRQKNGTRNLLVVDLKETPPPKKGKQKGHHWASGRPTNGTSPNAKLDLTPSVGRQLQVYLQHNDIPNDTISYLDDKRPETHTQVWDKSSNQLSGGPLGPPLF